jgi:hypothetical protein
MDNSNDQDHPTYGREERANEHAPLGYLHVSNLRWAMARPKIRIPAYERKAISALT